MVHEQCAGTCIHTHCFLVVIFTVTRPGSLDAKDTQSFVVMGFHTCFESNWIRFLLCSAVPPYGGADVSRGTCDYLNRGQLEQNNGTCLMLAENV